VLINQQLTRQTAVRRSNRTTLLIKYSYKAQSKPAMFTIASKQQLSLLILALFALKANNIQQRQTLKSY
jgi:hypothetical protein